MPKKVTDAAIKEYLEALTNAPRRIAACTDGVDASRLSTPPAPGEWSMVEIMAHMRGCCEVWSYSIFAMITLDSPELAFIHPREWSKKLGYANLPFAENFQPYQIERQNLVRILSGLKFADWDRSARFSGKVNIHTIFDEVMRMAMHDLDHCNQIEAMFPQT